MQSKNLYKYLSLLTAKQKRAFRLFYTSSDTEKKKEMIALFDYLNNAKQFNNNHLKENFKNQNLSRSVIRLYDIIEDFILYIDKQKDEYDQVQNLIAKAKKQYAFGFYDKALKHLLTAENISNCINDIGLHLKVLNEIKIIFETTLNLKELATIENKLNQNIDKLFSNVRFSFMLSKIGVKLRKKYIANTNAKSETDLTKNEIKFINQPIEKVNSILIPDLLELKNKYFLHNKKYDLSLKISEEQIKYWEKQNVSDFQLSYLSIVLHKTIFTQIALNKIKDAEKILNKLVSIEQSKQYFANNFSKISHVFINSSWIFYSVNKSYILF